MNAIILKITGVLFVGLAALGVILPLLPTTPFLLVAATCFAKSSPRLYQKLLNNKVFGPLIVNWRANRSIPKKAKLIALLSIVFAGAYSVWFLDEYYFKFAFVFMMMFPIIFIARLPLSVETKNNK